MMTLSILIVDDDPVLRRLLEERLKKAGYTTEVAEDGYKAKEILDKQRFDVVLTDLMMPGDIGGIEVLEIANKTEDEAAQTIQTLELLNSKLQQSLEDVETVLSSENSSAEDNIADALAIISRT